MKPLHDPQLAGLAETFVKAAARRFRCLEAMSNDVKGLQTMFAKAAVPTTQEAVFSPADAPQTSLRLSWSAEAGVIMFREVEVGDSPAQARPLLDQPARMRAAVQKCGLLARLMLVAIETLDRESDLAEETFVP